MDFFLDELGLPLLVYYWLIFGLFIDRTLYIVFGLKDLFLKTFSTKSDIFLVQIQTIFNPIDFTDNTWACSPKLAWMHLWKSTLNPKLLTNNEDIRCIHEIHHTSRLFLVMQYYEEIVLPHCPLEDGCRCLIHSIQDTIITTLKRHYTVHVNCAASNLRHFPALPEHTQAVDLSNNKINNSAFYGLDVKRDHYSEVENLTLDGNRLEDLPEKLLEMNLGMRFSAKDNYLTSVSCRNFKSLPTKFKLIFLQNT